MPEITNVDNGSVRINGCIDRDESLALSGAATVKEGTILARKVVNDDVVVTPGTNTGNGTCTVASVVPGNDAPVPGVHRLQCVTEVANGGVFRMTDPNGEIIDAAVTMTPGAGAATVLTVGGIRFTLTDGSTNFAAGDYFDITVTANGSLVPFAPAGSGGAQHPVAVLDHTVTALGASSRLVRAIVAGEVNRNRLVIHGGGSVTKAHIEALRHYAIIATETQQLARLDNQ